MKSLLLSLTVATLTFATTAQASDDLSNMTWPQVVAQAKKEGTVVWYNWFYQDRFRGEVKSFENHYGIKVIIPDGSHDANMNKFLAQSSRPTGDIDVLSLGGSDLAKFKPEKMLIGPLSNLLPQSNTLKYKMEGVDSKGYAVAYWGNQTGIAYNPSLISQKDLPQTLADFSAYFAKHPGMFGFNYEKGGSGPAFFQSIVRNVVPDIDYQTAQPTANTMAKLTPAWKWFNQRRGQYIITASNSDSMTRLNGGEFAMVASWEDLTASLQKEGDISKAIKFYIPKMTMPGGGNVVMIPKNAPHPAAALLFIHWLTSAKTQVTFNKDFGSVPQNTESNSHYALVNKAERKNSSIWPDKPLSDAINKAFINHVIFH